MKRILKQLLLLLLIISSLVSCSEYRPPVSPGGGNDSDNESSGGGDTSGGEGAFTVSIRYNGALIRKPECWDARPTFHTKLDTRVSILKIHPGITPATVRDILLGTDTRAVIVETYGAGNAPSKEWFISIVREASERGKILLNVTQCVAGRVNMDLYATGKSLKTAGVLNGYDSTTESALGKLFYLLGIFESNEDVKARLEMDLRGEISK